MQFLLCKKDASQTRVSILKFRSLRYTNLFEICNCCNTTSSQNRSNINDNVLR